MSNQLPTVPPSDSSAPLLKRLAGRWFRFYRDQQAQAELITTYRSTFGNTADAKSVLAHHLIEMCFFAETRCEEDVVLNNAAKRLLRDMGIWNEANALSIVNALMTVEEVNDGRPSTD